MITILGFTGSREGMNIWQVQQCIDLIKKIKPKETHLGDCVGADHEFYGLIKGWSSSLVVGHPPINPKNRVFLEYNWSVKEKEYITRNHDIVKASQLIIAAPKETDSVLRSGTWATIRFALQMRKPMIIIYPRHSTYENIPEELEDLL